MILIKDIPTSERPRERLMKYGLEYLSNTELISIILKTGTKGENVTNLASKVLKQSKGIENLKNISKEKLFSIKGIGEAKACELLAAIELGKRIYIDKQNNKKIKFKTNI